MNPELSEFRLQIQETPACSNPQFKFPRIHRLGEIVVRSSIQAG